MDRCRLAVGARAEEDWGFLAQETLEKLLKALLWSFTARNRPAAIRCNVCCRSLAHYDAEPTPLPVELRLLLEQLEAFPAEVRQRLS